MSSASRALADGLDEARRGLWRSAAESFRSAGESDPGAALAHAVCLLRLERLHEAIVWLETAAVFPPPAPWMRSWSWLCAVARAQAADPEGAERAARDLPEGLRLRVEAQVRLRAGDYRAGVERLLRCARPRRP